MELTKQVRLLNEDLSNSAPRMFDDVSGLLFWDDINNQVYYEIYQTMRENFWQPDEVSMQQDTKDWENKMSDDEKILYKEGTGVLASLDSIATVFDHEVSKYIKDSAIKANMAFIGAMEVIHNESYTYNVSSIVDKVEALEVFEHAKKNKFVVRRNKLMMDIFSNFFKEQTIGNLLKGLVAMSGLEGLCFVNGFTPFYYFNRNEKMFGTGTIIRFIQRDEVQHAYFQTVLVRDILSQYPEYNTDEFSDFIYDFFVELVKLEKEFCEDLYRNTSGIDIEEVKEYIEYKANLILDNLGLTKIFETKKNPMNWIKAYEPENANSVKSDFFEDKESNYTKTSETANGWDDL